MRVTYIGSYEADYPRNQTIRRGLEKNGVEVTELHIDLWGQLPHKFKIGWKTKILLGLKYGFGWLYLIIRGLFHRTDCFIVGYPGHWDVFPCRILAFLKRKPIVFDVFFSLWDGLVLDRETVSEKSLKARILYHLDSIACRMADQVLLDTNENIDFFVEKFGLPRDKFSAVLVGCNTEVYRVREEIPKREAFAVAFHGKAIPLQGLEFIVRAAALLADENIRFVITAAGQTAEKSKAEAEEMGIENIEWHGMTPPEELAKLECSCHVGLGVFGITDKTQRVIPNKVFETANMGLPLITGDTPAVRSLFTPEKDAILLPVGDPQAIANAIIRLRDDAELRNKLSTNALELGRKTWRTEDIGAQTLDAIQRCAKNH